MRETIKKILREQEILWPNYEDEANPIRTSTKQQSGNVPELHGGKEIELIKPRVKDWWRAEEFLWDMNVDYDKFDKKESGVTFLMSNKPVAFYDNAQKTLIVYKKEKLQEANEAEKPKGTYFRSGDWEGYKFNPYEVKTDNLEEFFIALDNLPDTIEELSVPLETQMFDSKTIKFYPEEESNWKEKTKDIVRNIAKDHDYLSYALSSYYGDIDFNKPYEEHPFYISYRVPDRAYPSMS